MKFSGITIFIYFVLNSAYCQNGVRKDYALFFPVTTYEFWTNLFTPVDDANKIANELKENYDFEPEVVPNAEKQIILDKLNEYSLKKYNENDQLLIFFSGHGHKDGNESNYFVPSNGKKGIDDLNGESYLFFPKIRNIINAIPCKHVLLVVDACYSGNIIEPHYSERYEWQKRPGETEFEERKRFIEEGLEGYTRRILTSGGDERTPDPSDFAEAFLKALIKGGEKLDILTYDDMWSNLKHVKPSPKRGKFGKHTSGDFMFIRIKPKKINRSSSSRYSERINIANNLFQLGDYTNASKAYIEAFTYGNDSQQKFCNQRIDYCAPYILLDQGKHLLEDGDCIMARVKFDEASELGINIAEIEPFLKKMRDCINQNLKSYHNGDKFSDFPWLELVYVEEGNYLMGSNDYFMDEKPTHNVKLSAFLISKTEITQEQWQIVMGYNPSYFEGCPECPVESVSWDEANSFVKELSKMTNEKYRLPTEAEWEYAANGANMIEDETFSGDSQLKRIAWYIDNANGTVHKVAQKFPNELGIYDMTGNVQEWCFDYYGSEFYADSPFFNPKGEPDGTFKVVRGGSFNSSESKLRIKKRGYENRNTKHKNVGIRVVREIPM